MMALQSWHREQWLLSGAIAIALSGLGVTVDRQTFFACWLAGWWTCTGAVLGSQANLWMHNLTGGAWGQPLRPVWQRTAAAMPVLMVLMLPVIAAVWMFYPWSEPDWVAHSSRPAFQTYWLSPVFVTGRLIIYAVLWLALGFMTTRPARNGPLHKGVSGIALIIYGVTVSLASVDLLASLIPQWYSSGFGLIIVAMQMKLGFALGVVCVRIASDTTKNMNDTSDPTPASIRGDWGNMLLMYVLMWAYVAFVQFLIIWAENLPNEIAWYVPRMQTSWVWLGVVLVVAGFFAPLFLLLFRAIKQDRSRLHGIAAGLCMLGWLECIWVTLPSVAGLSWHAMWMAPLGLAGMAALLIAMVTPRKNARRSSDRFMQRRFRGTGS